MNAQETKKSRFPWIPIMLVALFFAAEKAITMAGFFPSWELIITGAMSTFVQVTLLLALLVWVLRLLWRGLSTVLTWIRG